MLVPWFETPLFAELEAFRRDVDALVSAPLTFDVPRGVAAGRGLHFREDGERYVVHADLPGVAPEALTVEVTGRQLSVGGRRALVVEDGWKLQHRERADYDFQRNLLLPDDVDTDKIEASLRDGVLEVSLPRLPKTSPRRVAVSA